MQKFDYRFDSKTRIFYKYYFGEITIEDITISWEYAFDHKLIPEATCGFILDYSQANFRINLSEYQQIPLFYKQHPEVFYKCRVAILTTNPANTVIPILVKQKDEGYESQPFSTLEAAQNWILQKEFI